MSLQELAKQATQLSISDRLALVVVITESIHREIESKPQQSSTQWLRGLLKSDASPLSDDEIKAEYVDYLIQKYQ